MGIAGLDMSVTNERKIWEAAILLVSRHGDQATDIAEREATRHHRRHDELTSTVWCWISRATAELLREEPDIGEHFH
ncbi:MAG TPA: hypothetical protein VFA50_02415 [Stellaceae bacterium]|nr:hypothetical protein [Stellaceae bacterium]